MKNNSIIITIIVAIIVGAGGFFVGMHYQKSQRATFAGQFSGAPGANGQTRRFGQGGPGGRAGGGVFGEILSTDDTSLTVKLPDGSSKIVVLSKTTTINKAAMGAKDDLKTGERVAVFGTTNSDGSVTAQSVQLNPQMRGTEGAATVTK